MESSAKRRRLAPKVSEASSLPETPSQPQAQQKSPVVHDQSHLAPERHEIETFARHLQDAAMHIYRQTQQPQYTGVSVLLLRWEEDGSVDDDLHSLEKVFRERYNYQTDIWHIPTVPNPSIKLGVRMASFLEHAQAGNLLVIYYAGQTQLVGPDNQLYWACNSREDAAKLKWDGVRCLFEDAQSDMLLLLDSCAVKDAPVAGSHGLKQAMAAYSHDQPPGHSDSPSFTAVLVESLLRLGTGRPFGVQRLYEQVLSQRQSSASPKAEACTDKTPVLFALTPPRGRTLSLVPLPSSVSEPHPDASASESASTEHGVSTAEGQADVTFDEARVLVCTTFVGEACPDMTFFNQWLQRPHSVPSRVSVEGMFLGPPTMLMMSMPLSVWNVVQHDKVCCLLGFIKSHNLVHLYNRFVRSNSDANTDGREPLQVKHAAAGSPVVVTGRDAAPPLSATMQTNTFGQERKRHHVGKARAVGSSSSSSLAQPSPAGMQDHVGDTAEMQEAAEQLKALSHDRHMGNKVVSPGLDGPNGLVADGVDVPSSPDTGEFGVDDANFGAGMLQTKSAARKPLLKQAPRPDTTTACHLCSHGPFKDASSRRKHVAAAHTRPFPCAFSFAGCGVTFGSKNEWKRHISSQHLCLQYFKCSSCSGGAGEGKGNEFNRKDLFTQHLRRMHAPKKMAKGDKMQMDFERTVKEMQASCLVTRRQPPHRCTCPKADCQSLLFEGPGAWDEWTEHVGRHMEKGEGQQMSHDLLLAQWALDEGIIEPTADGAYRLCNGNGGGGNGERDDQANAPLYDQARSRGSVDDGGHSSHRAMAAQHAPESSPGPT